MAPSETGSESSKRSHDRGGVAMATPHERGARAASGSSGAAG